MDIMELGAVGELIGGVAVVATLLYLAAQVRYTKSEITNVRTEYAMTAYVRWYEQLAEPETARLWDSAINDYDSLAREDQLRFHSLMVQVFGTYVQTVSAQQEKMYTTHMFEPQEKWFAKVFNTRGGATWWAINRDEWPGEVVERFRGRQEQFREGHPMVPPGAYRGNS